MLNKHKINNLAVTNQFNFHDHNSGEYTEALAKFLAGYMLNKEL